MLVTLKENNVRVSVQKKKKLATYILKGRRGTSLQYCKKCSKLKLQAQYLGLRGSDESKDESSCRPVQETEADLVCPLGLGTGVLSPSSGMLLRKS